MFIHWVANKLAKKCDRAKNQYGPRVVGSARAAGQDAAGLGQRQTRPLDRVLRGGHHKGRTGEKPKRGKPTVKAAAVSAQPVMGGPSRRGPIRLLLPTSELGALFGTALGQRLPRSGAGVYRDTVTELVEPFNHVIPEIAADMVGARRSLVAGPPPDPPLPRKTVTVQLRHRTAALTC
jgi:hypothetical protein